MCGRFTLIADPKELLKTFPFVDNASLLFERYNIAPSQEVPVIYHDNDKFYLKMMSWGLTPSWAKDHLSVKPINARLETLKEKPLFRNLVNKNRCLIPASGFYEWRKDTKPKQPYYIYHPKVPILAFAGLWDHHITTNGELINSCTIITTKAQPEIASIHDRMPLIISPAYYKDYLTLPEVDFFALRDPTPLQSYPVNKKVNFTKIEDQSLIEKLEI